MDPIQIAILILGVCFVALGKIAYDTLHRGRWGITFGPWVCPRCDTRQSMMLRRPRSVRQALWGGFTCATCGAELDKWGRVVPAA